MDEPDYGKQLYGDISAMTQSNRATEVLVKLLERADWHARLLNGSDYPLPGVMPIFSVRELVARGLLAPEAEDRAEGDPQPQPAAVRLRAEARAARERQGVCACDLRNAGLFPASQRALNAAPGAGAVLISIACPATVSARCFA